MHSKARTSDCCATGTGGLGGGCIHFVLQGGLGFDFTAVATLRVAADLTAELAACESLLARVAVAHLAAAA